MSLSKSLDLSDIKNELVKVENSNIDDILVVKQELVKNYLKF